MENSVQTKRKKWPLVLLGIVIIGAIGSQIECTIAVPRCCGLYWQSAPCRHGKKRSVFSRSY